MGRFLALAVIAAVLLLPLGVRLHYDSEGFRVWAKLGFFRLLLYPRPSKPKKAKEKNAKKEKPQEKTPQNKQTKKKEEPKGGSLADFLPFVRLALDFLGDFRRKLRVDRLYVRVILAGGDPADLAVNYGRAWAALGNLQPQLERVLKIRKRDIQLGCDFAAGQTLVIARMDLTLTIGRVLALAAVYGIRGLKEFLIFKKKRKGGANNEPKITEHAGIHHSKSPGDGGREFRGGDTH